MRAAPTRAAAHDRMPERLARMGLPQGQRASDVLAAGIAALPTFNVPTRVLLAPLRQVRRGCHQALGQADPGMERNLIIAAGAGLADETGGEENSDHDVLRLDAPISAVELGAAAGHGRGARRRPSIS